MGLPSTPYLLYFHYFGPTAAHSHFSTSYTTHNLLFLSFRAFLSSFTSSRLICLSHGPVIHYSFRLGLMGFLSVCQLFSVSVAGLLPSTWASEMAINTLLIADYTTRRVLVDNGSSTNILYYPAFQQMKLGWDPTSSSKLALSRFRWNEGAACGHCHITCGGGGISTTGSQGREFLGGRLFILLQCYNWKTNSK